MNAAEPIRAQPSRAKIVTGGGDLREAQVDALNYIFGLAWYSFIQRSLIEVNTSRRNSHIKMEETTSDCPATNPRGPGTNTAPQQSMLPSSIQHRN
jgi:hypothetical protein